MKEIEQQIEVDLSTAKRKLKKASSEIHSDLNTAFIVVLILKAGGLVNWSWWIILSPYLLRILLSAIEGFVEGFKR